MSVEVMSPWIERHAEKVVSAERAVARVRPGQRVFVGSGAAQPQTLVEALTARPDLDDTELVHIMTLGLAPYAQERFGGQFRHNAYFIGPNVREAVSEGRADYTPIFLSEIPRLFRERRTVIDVALISVSPPDAHGYCTYGVATDIVKSAAESARFVIAEVNEQMPRILGDCFIHVDDIDLLVASDRPLIEGPQGKPGEVAQRIGKHIANLIEDGSTLQLGIGQIPDAVLGYLGHMKNLGIHTEMFSDGVIDLVEKGVINNRSKTFHPGKIIASFVIGTRRLYDFVDDNPLIEFHPTEYTNDPFNVAKNDKMVSINAAIEVDFTGQVCADSLGELFYSGIGGQVDFVRGAARSRGGKPVIALPSTAKDGTISRIVPHLKQGAGVVTSRGDVHYVVTEYGVAYLHGKSMRERAMALIEIAHPKFRPWLLAEAKARHIVYQDQVELPMRVTEYPSEWERWAELKDGRRVFLRPMRLSDEPRMREAFYRLSPQSVHQRFFHVMHTMPHAKLQEMMRIDYENDFGIVALTDSAEQGELIGSARYLRDPRTNYAEVAFTVVDEWHNLGVGTAMMLTLRDAARRHGIAGFTADVLAENHGMLSVLHKCGKDVESHLEDGVFSLTIPFDEPKREEQGPGAAAAPD